MDLWNELVDFVVEWWNSTINFSTFESSFKAILQIITWVFTFFFCYRTVYSILGLVGKAPKYKTAPMDKKYAVIIAARNEEKVIAKLIDSVRKQTYDQDKITVFVVADNCDDNTAKICRECGAIVYERHDMSKRTKGYALEFLFDNIEKDYGIKSYDYYLIFDADNLLKKDFVEKINDAFATGYDVCTSFRNIKNFETSVISSGYGFHYYRNTLTSHRPRSILGCSTHITGTGFGIKSDLLVDGWHHTDLTEDAEFSAITVAEGHTIGYCEDAEIYDEQPTTVGDMWRQRIRWRRGLWLNFLHNSPKLIKSFFKKPKWTTYDFFCHFFPYDLVSFLLTIILQLFTIIYSLTVHGSIDPFQIFNFLLGYFGGIYLASLFIGILVLIKERKRIHCNPVKKFIYLLTWAWFDMISVFVLLVSLFKKVKWVPTPHSDDKAIEDIGK